MNLIYIFLLFFLQSDKDSFHHFNKCEQIYNIINNDYVVNNKVIYDFIILEPLKNNAEYLEWRSELLFDLLEFCPKETINALSRLKKHKREMLYEELLNPIHDEINIQQIYINLTSEKYSTRKQKRVINEIKVVLELLSDKIYSIK